MKNIRLILFLIVAAAQLGVPGWAVRTRTATLRTGKLWKLRTEPVDPVDAVRGRYVALSFAAERVPMAEPLGNLPVAWAVLKEGTDGFAQVDHLSRTEVSGDNVIKVRPMGWYDDVQRVEFPFRRYWMAEQTAPAAEQAYREQTRARQNSAYVTIRVRDGDAAVEQLYIGDKPIAEYLREQAAK